MEFQKTVCYKISKSYYYQSYLGNPNSAKNDRITFLLCSYSNFAFPIILYLTKIKPLKGYEKCILFYLNFFFGSCNTQIVEGNKKVENGIIMTSWNGLLKFGKNQKSLWTKGSKMVRWWTTKEKIFWTYLTILKAVPGTFWDRVTTKNKFRFTEDFDIPLAQYLISKEILECFGYICGYLKESE